MNDLHHHYDQLSRIEREFVDDMARDIMREARDMLHPLNGNDDAEVAADALARWVIASRPDKERTCK